MNYFKQFVVVLVLVLSSCKEKEVIIKSPYIWKSIDVTATAYNSVPSQTQGNPIIRAWGDSLKLEIPSIAVSRDLLALGITHNTPVKIEGFDSIFLVQDKMNKRWRNRIDIYMGKDIKKAKKWGRKKICIEYGLPKANYLGVNP